MNNRAQDTTLKTVTVFVGSGRKNRGGTYAAARRFLDELESHGDVRGEIVFLSELDLGLCRGCKTCFEHGEDRCPLRGDREMIVEKMMASDGVVFASPNYSFQVSALMKSFLDRLGYLFHRPRFHGKTFAGIVVQGIYGGERIEKYLRFVGNGLGFDAVKGACITALEPMSEKKRRQMERTITGLARRFRARMLLPADAAPSLFKLMVFRMARTSMRQMLDAGNRDFVYYRDRGWFESDYYTAARLGLFKRALGALFDRVFARIYRPSEPGDQGSPRAERPRAAGAGASR